MRGATADNAPRGDGLCECGCGQPAPIAKRTTKSRGRVKDQPMRFIRGHNSRGMDRSGARTTHYVEQDLGFSTPCWIWQLSKTQPNTRSTGGYGKVTVKGRDYLAHRWYYEQTHGPIPKGMQLDHLCRNPACVNPAHLEVVTPLVNMRRSRSMKLTDEQSKDIEQRSRALGGGRAALIRLAMEFDVSYETVRLIYKNGAAGPRNPSR